MALVEGAGKVGGPAVRNRATLGGNLCNASPAADTATPLLAMGARVVIAGLEGERELPLAQLWQGPRKNTLAPGEVLKSVWIPARPPRSGSAFTRVTRSAMDIALVNAAAWVQLDAEGRLEQVTLTLGAVAPTVVVVPGLSEALGGQPVDPDVLEQVRKLAEAAATPIGDVRASAEYRRDMAGVLAARAVKQAVDRARHPAESSAQPKEARS